MRFERVLVGVDLEPLSATVLREAARLVSPKGTLHVVHVIDASLLALGHLNTDATSVLDRRQTLANTARVLLETLADDCGLAPGERVLLEIDFGEPADALVKKAADESSDLLVVGAHSGGALDRLLVGSVAEEVARRSPVPTLVVREHETATPGRVLVAIDTAETTAALEVVGVAHDLAQRLGAVLELAHVVAPPAVVGSVYGDVSPGLDTTLLGEVTAIARATLERFVSRFLPGARVQTHIFTGSPAREIAAHATPNDTIVCGTHAAGLLGRMAFGSVAAQLIRDAPCPVLVVGPGAMAPAALRAAV